MKFHRFFVEEKNLPTPLLSKEGIKGRLLSITSKELLYQWVNVLRLKQGEELVLFDGTGFEFHARIESLDKNQALLSIISSQDPGTEPIVAITLYQALIKKDNFEAVLQKGTEVGVSAFVPVMASRSEKKGCNAKRGRKIIQEATEQSGRVEMPKLYETLSLQDALKQASKPVFFLDSQNGATFRSETSKSLEVSLQQMSLFVGPEGGFTPEEIAMAKEMGAQMVSLGPRTLRAETAGPLAAGIIIYELDTKHAVSI